MPPSSTPERILVVRLSHLGDIAQAIPLIHALRSRWPSAEIGWAVQPEFAGLIEPLATVLPFDRRGGLGAWRSFRSATRRFGADLVIDAQGNWKSAFAALIATRGPRPCRRVAFARSQWQEPLAAQLLRPELAPPSSGPHLVQRALDLAAHVTGQPVSARLDPALTGEELDRGAHLLSPGNGATPVLLHPGVAGDPRSWPTASFGQLAEELLQRGVAVSVISGPGEEAAGRELQRALPQAHHIVGQRGLRTLAAAFRAAAEQRGCLVAGDSGPSHVAASVGLPVVLIAGPEDPAKTGPWPPSPADVHRVPGPDWQPRPITAVSVADALGGVLDQLTRLRAC
jgi:ADP-heptose:LPS heptosyltransferase